MIVGWTFDRTDVPPGQPAVGWDVDIPTWDGGLNGGVVQFEFADGSIEPLTLANVRTSGVSFDRTLFRAPFGSVWHQAGDARRSPELFSVEVFVVDDAGGISSAAGVANALVSAAPSVVRVESNIGRFFVLGLVSVSRSPVESGYRLGFEFGSLDGLRV